MKKLMWTLLLLELVLSFTFKKLRTDWGQTFCLSRTPKEKGVSCVLLTPLFYWCPGRELNSYSHKNREILRPKLTMPRKPMISVNNMISLAFLLFIKLENVRLFLEKTDTISTVSSTVLQI